MALNDKPHIPLNESIIIFNDVPVDGRYLVNSESELNQGYTHLGMFRFQPDAKKLWFKLDNDTWLRFPLTLEKGDAATINVQTVVSVGETGKVENLGTASNAILKFTLPRGLQGEAATIESIAIQVIDANQPARVENNGTTKKAQLKFFIPRGPQGNIGPKGDNFKIIGRGTFANRSTYDIPAYGVDTTYLVVDPTDEERNGLLYFKNTDNTWSAGLGLSSHRGWTPRLSLVQINENKIVLAVTDWFGGEGEKPIVPVGGYYVGAAGFTTVIADAINLYGKGDKGDPGTPGRPFLIDAQGTFAQRTTYDTESFPFNFLDIENGLVYQKLVDDSWGSPWSVGASAYEIWKQQGNEGTIADYQNSLKGADGTRPFIAFAENVEGLNPSWSNINRKFWSFHYALTPPADFAVFTEWTPVVGATLNLRIVIDYFKYSDDARIGEKTWQLSEVPTPGYKLYLEPFTEGQPWSPMETTISGTRNVVLPDYIDPTPSADPEGLETAIKVTYHTGDPATGWEFGNVAVNDHRPVMGSKVYEYLLAMGIDASKATFIPSNQNWTDYRKTGIYYGTLPDAPQGNIMIGDIKALEYVNEFGADVKINVIALYGAYDDRIYHRRVYRDVHVAQQASNTSLGDWRSYDITKILASPERWDEHKPTGRYYGNLVDGPVAGSCFVSIDSYDEDEGFMIMQQTATVALTNKMYVRSVSHTFDELTDDYIIDAKPWVDVNNALGIDGIPFQGSYPVWDEVKGKPVWMIQGQENSYDAVYYANITTGNNTTALANSTSYKWASIKSAVAAAKAAMTGNKRHIVIIEPGLYNEDSVNLDGVDMMFSLDAIVYSSVSGRPIFTDKYSGGPISCNILGKGKFFHATSTSYDDSEALSFKYASRVNFQALECDSIQMYGNTVAHLEVRDMRLIWGYTHWRNKNLRFYNCKFETGTSYATFDGENTSIEEFNCEYIQQDITNPELFKVRDSEGVEVLTYIRKNGANGALAQIDTTGLAMVDVANLVQEGPTTENYSAAISYNQSIYSNWGLRFINYKVRIFNPIIRVRRSKGIGVRVIQNFDNAGAEFLIKNATVIDETSDGIHAGMVQGKKSGLSTEITFSAQAFSARASSLFFWIPSTYLSLTEAYRTNAGLGIPTGTNTMPVIVYDALTNQYKQVPFPTFVMGDISQEVMDTIISEYTDLQVGEPDNTKTVAELFGIFGRKIKVLEAAAERPVNKYFINTPSFSITGDIITHVYNLGNITPELMTLLTELRILVDSNWLASNSNIKNFKIKIGTIAVVNKDQTSSQSQRAEGFIRNDNSLIQQYGPGASGNLQIAPNTVASSANFSQYTIDFTQEQPVTLEMTLANADDALTIKSVRIALFE